MIRGAFCFACRAAAGLFTIAAAAATLEKPLCAVLPIGGADDAVEAHNRELLAEAYARRLEETGRYRVLAGTALRRRFGDRIVRVSAADPAEAGLAAARALPVDLVVAGRVVQNGNLRTLHTVLVDARTLTAVKSVRSRYAGPVDRFVRLTPASNIALLFDIEASAPAVSAAPRGLARSVPARTARAAETAAPHDRRSPFSWSELKARFADWRGTPPAPEEPRLPGPLRYIEDHLELGLRSVRFSLEDTDGTFLGTINHLDAEQDSSLDRFFLRWWFVRYAGVEWTTEKIAARTRTSNGHSDGSIKAEGALFSALARYPFEVTIDRYTVQVVPYVGLGYAKMDLDFEPVSWWALGYASARHWANSGYSTSHYDDLTRSITLTDASGIALIGGIAVRVWEGVTLEFTMRELDLDTDARYTRRRPGQTGEIQHGTFPLSTSAYGFGLSYAF